MGKAELVPPHGEILISGPEILARLHEQAEELIDLYYSSKQRSEHPLIVGLLTGASKTVHSLVDAMVNINPYLDPDYDFIRTSAYGSGQKKGEVRILGDLAPDTVVKDRLVIPADDILETGESLLAAGGHIESQGAEILGNFVLLDRETDKLKPVIAKHVSFPLKTTKWVVGFGLNGPGGGRGLPYIAECSVQPKDRP